MYQAKTSAVPCPRCHALLDGVTNLTGNDGPKPRDYTMCVCCGVPLRFTDRLEFEAATIDAMPADLQPTFRFMQAVIHSRKAARN